jgi:hypothetical protein
MGYKTNPQLAEKQAADFCFALDLPLLCQPCVNGLKSSQLLFLRKRFWQNPKGFSPID